MSCRIEELKDGFKGNITVLLTQVNRGVTAKGAPYLSFVLQDKTGTMDAKYWNVSEETLYQYEPGLLIQASGDVISHNKQLQFRVQGAEILDQSDMDISDYVKEGPISKDELKQRMQAKLSELKNEKIASIVKSILADYEKDFYEYPAASKNHHDFVGGLATHVIGMLDIASNLCLQYPLLSKDVLYGGVILHDIGKLIELSGAIITEYTMEGKLLGHISIMQSMVDNKAKELGIEGEEVILLRHMILSHHGVYEYGSPVLPMIPEAEMLYLIDNIDARMNTIEKALKQINPGEFTTRIFALENRCFYKSKDEEQ
ncbi:MAG: HD domain-containing protein [Longicatena sp.]